MNEEINNIEHLLDHYSIVVDTIITDVNAQHVQRTHFSSFFFSPDLSFHSIQYNAMLPLPVNQVNLSFGSLPTFADVSGVCVPTLSKTSFTPVLLAVSHADD